MAKVTPVAVVSIIDSFCFIHKPRFLSLDLEAPFFMYIIIRHLSHCSFGPMGYYKVMKTHTSDSLDDLKHIAHEWLACISSAYADSDEALVVGLSGHLGAGKTAFSKMIAASLGVVGEVTSPTFVIMKLYDIDPSLRYPWTRLVHIDAYRLERREELEALNFEQVVADRNNLVLIEWPENVGLTDFVPQAHLSFAIHDGHHTVSVT